MRVNTLWTDSDETSGSEACGTRNGSFAIIVFTVSELSVGLWVALPLIAMLYSFGSGYV